MKNGNPTTYWVITQTLRNWLIGKGLRQKRRKVRSYYKWRDRKDYFGEMVLSKDHPWRKYPVFNKQNRTFLNVLDTRRLQY